MQRFILSAGLCKKIRLLFKATEANERAFNLFEACKALCLDTDLIVFEETNMVSYRAQTNKYT